MEIGISTASYFNKLSIEDAVSNIGQHGVRVCELFLNSFSEYKPEFIAMLRERMLATNLSAYSVHPMGIQFETLLFSQHDRQRSDSFKIYEHVLGCCKALGATHYVMHGAANLSGMPFKIDYSRFAEIFRRLIDLADSYGITLTLENVSWCLFSRPEFGERLRDAINDRRLKFTLDVKQAIRVGLSPIDFVNAFGDDIVNLHLCDAMVHPDGTYEIKMPGQGNVDFSSISCALRAHGYTGPAFIEVYAGMYSEFSTLYQSLNDMQRVFNR